VLSVMWSERHWDPCMDQAWDNKTSLFCLEIRMFV
jgi:hypothetical protein